VTDGRLCLWLAALPPVMVWRCVLARHRRDLARKQNKHRHFPWKPDISGSNVIADNHPRAELDAQTSALNSASLLSGGA